jgi:hypothetical protein
MADKEMKDTFRDDVNRCIQKCIHENGLQIGELQIERLAHTINKREIESWEENKNFTGTASLQFTNRHKEQISKFIRGNFRKSM